MIKTVRHTNIWEKNILEKGNSVHQGSGSANKVRETGRRLMWAKRRILD